MHFSVDKSSTFQTSFTATRDRYITLSEETNLKSRKSERYIECDPTHVETRISDYVINLIAVSILDLF